MDADLRHGLAEIEETLRAFAEDGDCTGVTDGRAAGRVDALSDAAIEAVSPGIVEDLTPFEVIGAAARFYLARATALAAPGEPGDDDPDLLRGYGMLRWLIGIAPEVVPPGLRRDLILDVDGGEPGELLRIADAALVLAQEAGDAELVDHAIRIFETLIPVAELADDRVHLRLNLGTGLGIRYGLTGEREDLDAAIVVLREALDDPGLDDQTRPMASINLSQALRLRWERFGDPADAAAAAAASPSLGSLPGADTPLGRSRVAQIRYAHTGDPAALDEAVEAARAAVGAHPEPGRDRAEALSNLATALRLRFGRMSDGRDLMDAVEAAREGVAAHAEPSPEAAESLSALCVVLQIRFQHLGRPDDLDEAIDAGRSAVAAYPQDDPASASCLSNLSNALRTRYQLSRQASDLAEAVGASRKALGLTGPADSNRSHYLNNLSIALQLHSAHHGDDAALDEALHAAAQAVRSSRGDQGARHNALTTLSIGVQLLGRRAGAGDAILQEVAAGLAPEDVDELNRLLAQ